MHKEILSKKQVDLLPLIKQFNKEYYLVGDTAIALFCGHRRSIDFELFKKGHIKRKSIHDKIEKTGLQFRILYQEEGQIHFDIAGVKVTFFDYPYEVPAKNNFEKIISVPDLLDLAAMKTMALAGRAKWKDYVDIYFILKDYFTLAQIIVRSQELFANFFSEKLFRQQLCYFDDINYTEEVEYLKEEIPEATIKTFLTEIALQPLV